MSQANPIYILVTLYSIMITAMGNNDGIIGDLVNASMVRGRYGETSSLSSYAVMVRDRLSLKRDVVECP